MVDKYLKCGGVITLCDVVTHKGICGEGTVLITEGGRD